jgi:hypothetical protein
MKLGILIGLILVSTWMRLLPHPANFSPLMAVALFSGAFLGERRWLACLVPLAALFLSDLVIGFDATLPFVYGAMILAVLMGQLLARALKPKTTTSVRVAKGVSFLGFTTLATVAASLLFFVISNFGVWWVGRLYPLTQAGLVNCYLQGLPFLLKSLCGDLVYTYLLFSAWLALCVWMPKLSEASSHG